MYIWTTLYNEYLIAYYFKIKINKIVKPFSAIGDLQNLPAYQLHGRDLFLDVMTFSNHLAI